MRSHETFPGGRGQDLADRGLSRAAERITLACRALAAAANDLRVEYARHKVVPVDEAASMVEAETERVCELAEDLARLAMNLRRPMISTPAAGPRR